MKVIFRTLSRCNDPILTPAERFRSSKLPCPGFPASYGLLPYEQPSHLRHQVFRQRAALRFQTCAARVYTSSSETASSSSTSESISLVDYGFFFSSNVLYKTVTHINKADKQTTKKPRDFCV